MGLFGGGVTGQSSTNSNPTTTLGEGASQNSPNSNNNTDASTNQGDGGISAQGNVTVNAIDGGILDTAGQISGQSLALLGHIVDSALGAVDRVVETGFGSANRSTDSVAKAGADASAAIAAAKGLDTVGQWRPFVPYIIGAVVLLGAVAMLAFRRRKGKRNGP